MQIIIDGYNLIGNARGLTGNLEAKRDHLVQQLQQYHQRKGYPITVVFDGWRSGWIYEAEERAGEITVIFSQKGEKADSVIQRLARELGHGCIVVTSDREVRSAVETSGAVAIYAGEFNAKLRNPDEDNSRDEDLERSRFEEKRGNPKRLSKTERKRRERLKKL